MNAPTIDMGIFRQLGVKVVTLESIYEPTKVLIPSLAYQAGTFELNKNPNISRQQMTITQDGDLVNVEIHKSLDIENWMMLPSTERKAAIWAFSAKEDKQWFKYDGKLYSDKTEISKLAATGGITIDWVTDVETLEAKKGQVKVYACALDFTPKS